MFLSLMFSSVLAATPDRHNGSVVGRPAITIDESDCRLEISRQFVAVGLIDDVILADARARAICTEAVGDLELARASVKVLEAKALVVAARAGNDTVMTAGAATAAANGGSTSYTSSPTGTTRVLTGDAATASELATSLVGYGFSQYPTWYGGGYGDPRLDASAMLAGQAYAGFNASQRSSEVWRSQAAKATLDQATTADALAKSRAEAANAAKRADALRKERDALATDLEAVLEE